MSKIFEEFTIKELTLKNRIVMPAMCMYSAGKDGYANDWHFTHYTARAIGGVGLIILEATGIEPKGRISDSDLGIWDDSHIEGLKKTVDLGHRYGAKMGIQLAHAGRKSTVEAMECLAPSAIAFSDRMKKPREMTQEDIQDVVRKFGEAAKRALLAGFDIVEIHGAHGYLINEFLSPLSNERTDAYGGSLENRTRFLGEVIASVRKEWPESKPLQLRISAHEYVEGGNEAETLAEMINLVKSLGIDIVDVSTGGVVLCEMDVYPGYQVKHAEIIKENTGLPVIAGGLLTSPLMVEEILKNERAELVFLGRELLRDPNWVYRAARELHSNVEWPIQYERAYK